jgi:hypothetical protein
MEQDSIKFAAGALALLLLVPALTGSGMKAADEARTAGIIVSL